MGKIRLVTILKDSSDGKVKTAGVELKKGKTWATTKDVKEAESRIRHTSKDIVGTVVEVHVVL